MDAALLQRLGCTEDEHLMSESTPRTELVETQDDVLEVSVMLEMPLIAWSRLSVTLDVVMAPEIKQVARPTVLRLQYCAFK